MASFNLIKTFTRNTIALPSIQKLRTSSIVKFSSDSSSNKPIFNPHDALFTDFLLNEEEIKMRDVVRDYARNELMPRIVKANRNEVFDREIFKEMGRLGILGCTVG